MRGAFQNRKISFFVKIHSFFISCVVFDEFDADIKQILRIRPIGWVCPASDFDIFMCIFSAY